MSRKSNNPGSVEEWRENLRYCNCAECGEEAVGAVSWGTLGGGVKKVLLDSGLRFIAGRIEERPYCNICLKKKKSVPPGRVTSDENPSQENALRALEETNDGTP